MVDHLKIKFIFQKNSIKELWNGEKMKIIREGLSTNDPIKACQLCLENEKFNV